MTADWPETDDPISVGHRGHNGSKGSVLYLATNSGNLTRDGYSFGVWNRTNDGGRIDYAEVSSYITIADWKLYTEWISRLIEPLDRRVPLSFGKHV